jgi:RHS repeat-associated protein
MKRRYSLLISRAMLLSLLILLLFSYGTSDAATCSDCCVFPGGYDGTLTNGAFYKDVGGLRQVQYLRQAYAASGGCYRDYDQADQLMNDYAALSYSVAQGKGSVTPCLSLPPVVNTDWRHLFGTAYGGVFECSGGKYWFGASAYYLQQQVGCIDSTIDMDLDGINDCIDECPTIEGYDGQGCPVGLSQGVDETDDPCASQKGNPISIYNGNKLESEQDLNFPSPFADGLTFKRFYNSQSENNSPMGYGWTHSYNITLKAEASPVPGTEYLVVTDETGFVRYFSRDTATGGIIPQLTGRTSMWEQNDTFVWQQKDGSTYTFDETTYQLLHIEDRQGNRQAITYDVSDPTLIDTVLDEASGRSLKFSYTNSLLTTIRLYSGVVDGGIQVTYGHDANGNLTGVTFPEGSGFVYEYDDANPDVVPYINNLTRKSDAAGHMLARWTYDDQDRCDFNETGDGRGVSIDFDTTPGAVVLTDAYGADRTYQLTTIQGRKRISSVTGGSGCASCIDEPIRWRYDQHLNVIEKEYANGRIDQFSGFDNRGNPGTITQAVGTADEQVITTTWHPVLEAPLARAEQSVIGIGSKVTTWDYDDDGNDIPNENPTTLVHRIIVSGYSLDAYGLEIPVESITKFSYNTKGQLLGVDGPLAGTADTVTYGYNATTGDLTGQTMPVSGTKSFSNHDAAGRPGRVTDANANSIDYTYDGRGRLDTATRLWDSAVTDYDYNAAGKLDTVTLANGVTYTYTYDAVYGQLETITDALGNTIEHGYDAQGNIIDTGYHLPGGTKTFWQRFDYQYPGRPGKLWKQINPDNSYYEYAYDAVGNLNQTTDPEGKITTYGYDLLNRRTSMIQPGTVTTDYVYDGQGNMVLVTDPESHTTEYVVDDLGRTVKIVSPDSGTSVYGFDAAGNLVARTDANNITSTYTYDDEYRLTGIQYPDTSQNVTYTYDAGVNGMGRLTGKTDPSGSYVYGWDEAGNLASEQKTIDSVVYTTGYDYDAAGLLTEMTYPDGLIVTWQRDAVGNVSGVTATRGGVPRTLAGTIAYLPFGTMEAMTLGNGVTVDRTFDQQYRMTTDLSTGIQSLDFDHDLVGNVTAITNLLDATRDLTFGYDDLYQVTSATGIYGTLGFGFDDVGNRLSRTDGGSTETYTYTIDTNRLDMITNGGTTDIVIDSAGNTIGYGTRTLSYTQANRLAQVQDGGNTLGAYVYSADGRRMKKTVGSQVAVYHYDTAGQLIGESDGQGNLTRLYVYLNGEPLSQITVAGGTESTYYYHTDHLGTPQKMTDGTGAIVWAADYLPFGDVSVAVGTVENNLRFAGQYFDTESGLHYNYHRYYVPAIGRYLTPDPIGLEGGINLYSYVHNNPVNLIDSFGLSPAGWLVRLTNNAYKTVKKASKKEAVQARKKGENVKAKNEQTARAIEKAARNGDTRGIRKHKGHELDDGSTGMPHYQTDGVPGHTFWGSFIGFLTLFDPTDVISGELGNSDWMPPSEPCD